MKVIIDASNVAHFGKGKEGSPILDNVLKAIEALSKLGYEPFAIADASLRHEIDKKEEFNKLLEEKKIRQVPSGTTADHFILKLLKKKMQKYYLMISLENIMMNLKI